MIKLDKIVSIDEVKSTHRIVRVDLIADESIEVEDIGTDASTIIGLRPTDVLAMGSTCFTAAMEFGMLDSTGNWRFQ